MRDLVEFMHRENLPALAQAAVAHAQFEMIHPFADGNGRTGRALLHALLRAKGLTRHVSVPVSSGLLVDTAGYFEALNAYREGDAGPIISCVARATLVGVVNGRRLVADLHEVREKWRDALAGVRSHSAVHALADGLLRHPVISAEAARGILGAGTNGHRHIDVLVERKILIPQQDYKTRNRTWRAPDVLAVLDAYAARSARRVCRSRWSAGLRPFPAGPCAAPPEPSGTQGLGA